MSPIGYSGWFPGEIQLRQSRATQPAVHAWCFSASIIHQALTWTTGSLSCAQMLVNACDCTRGVYGHRKRESALKVDSGRKIPCRTGESNLRQRRAGPTLYRLSYIPALVVHSTHQDRCTRAKIPCPPFDNSTGGTETHRYDNEHMTVTD